AGGKGALLMVPSLVPSLVPSVMPWTTGRVVRGDRSCRPWRPVVHGDRSSLATGRAFSRYVVAILEPPAGEPPGVRSKSAKGPSPQRRGTISSTVARCTPAQAAIARADGQLSPEAFM